MSVRPFELRLEVIRHLGKNAEPPEADDTSRSSKEGAYKSGYPKLAMQTCEV